MVLASENAPTTVQPSISEPIASPGPVVNEPSAFGEGVQSQNASSHEDPRPSAGLEAHIEDRTANESVGHVLPLLQTRP